MFGIHPEKNQESHTGPVQKPGDQMTRRKNPVKIHLSKENGSTAVRNQPDESRDQNTGQRFCLDERIQCVFPQKQERQIQKKRDGENKDKDISGMLQRGKGNASVFTMAVFLLAEPLDQKSLAIIVFALPK